MIGLCRKCLGCTMLGEDMSFKGTYECKDSTYKMTQKEIELEQKKIKLLESKGIKIK